MKKKKVQLWNVTCIYAYFFTIKRYHRKIHLQLNTFKVLVPKLEKTRGITKRLLQQLQVMFTV